MEAVGHLLQSLHMVSVQPTPPPREVRLLLTWTVIHYLLNSTSNKHVEKSPTSLNMVGVILLYPKQEWRRLVTQGVFGTILLAQ